MNTSEVQPNPIPPEVEARIRELQALITDSHQRADKSDDEDIREALNLQISKLGLKVARLRRGQPEELPSEMDEPEAKEEVEALPQPTLEEMETADKLIQRARLERQRGNKQAASDLIKQAGDAAPGSATVLEAVGDHYADARQYVAAKDAYRAAHRADPKNASVERKLAQLSMAGMADMSIEDQLRMGSFDSPFIQRGEAMASPKSALILSIFFPGLGQIVLGQAKKGLTIMGIFLVSAILFALLATKLHPQGQKSLPMIAYFPLAIAAAAWFAGILDASANAKSTSASPMGATGKPNKPTPPVNLPFE